MENERWHHTNMIFENMTPSFRWAENHDSHRLMIHLPGFKNEEVRIRAGDNYDNIIVSGERQIVSDNKTICFEQSFMVPQACNIEDTSGIIEDDDVFCVTFPKRQSTQLHEIPPVENYSSFLDETLIKDAEEREKEVGCTDSAAAELTSKTSLLDKISMNLKKTPSFILTTLLAFSLGVVVSHYHHSAKHRSKDHKKDDEFRCNKS